jgi:hypothetical protein
MGNKIFQYVKYASWGLLLVGVLIVVIGAIAGLDAGDYVPVDVLLYWAYALVAIALLAIVGLGLYIAAVNDINQLKKIGIVVGGAVVLVLVAWLLAPGSAPLAYNGPAVTEGDLTLTDTVLNLTYITCAASLAAIVFSTVWKARK